MRLSFLKNFLASTFTDLSFWKRWVVRISLLMLVGGGIWVAVAGGDSEGGWAGVRAGFGFIFGFAVGALVRAFLKLSLIVGAVLAGVGFALNELGWIDLPGTWSDISLAFGKASKEQAESLQAFLSSYMPASAMSAFGLGSGLTQKPSFSAPEE